MRNRYGAQESLPRVGENSVRSAAQLTPSTFLASAAGCSTLVHQILPLHLLDVHNPVHESALSIWHKAIMSLLYLGEPLIDKRPRMHPRSRSRLHTTPFWTPLLSPTLRHAVATKESGAWLSAPPISSVGLHMEDNVIHAAVGLCLGVQLCELHLCCHCGAVVDHLCTHGLSCRFSRGRHSRHAAINDMFLGAAKIPYHLKPMDLYRLNGKHLHRPIGGWEGARVGRHLPRHSPTPSLLSGKQKQWRRRQRGRRGPSTLTSKPATISCQ